MAESDPALYEQAIRRIRRIIVTLGIAGAAGIAFWRGVPAGFAFLIGATASYLSFLGWQQIANAMGPTAKKRSSRYFILRILAFVALAYVIMRLLGLSAAAAVAGMLVSAAAIMLEIIYELIYART